MRLVPVARTPPARSANPNRCPVVDAIHYAEMTYVPDHRLRAEAEMDFPGAKYERETPPHYVGFSTLLIDRGHRNRYFYR